MFVSKPRQTLAIVALVIASSSALMISCSQDSAPAATQPLVFRDEASALQQLTGEQRARLANARARTRWVGDAHHRAMEIVIAAVDRYRRAKKRVPRRGSVEYCAILEQAGSVALRVIDSHRGTTRSNAEHAIRLNQDPELAGCANTLSVLKAPGAPMSRTASSQSTDPEVTGAYEEYLDPMDAAVWGSDGSVRSVTSRLDEVLAQAISRDIPEGDLLALAAFAGLIESSAIEWNAYEWPPSGGAGSGSDDAQMSVFAVRRWDSRPLKVIGADAGGCLSTVKGWGALKALLVGPAWAALAGECGLRAALASGGALLALM